jgi:hypothetical protein
MAINIPSLRYVLPNCFFTKKELNKVQQAALCVFVAKSRFNRNTHRSVVFAPICFGGCGFSSLYLLQGEGQILGFLEHWRTAMDSGHLLRIAISWTQLHLGISFSFLTGTTTPLLHMPGQWLKSLRMFLASFNGPLELEMFYLPPIQRHDDVYIMDMVLHAGCFSDSEICQN